MWADLLRRQPDLLRPVIRELARRNGFRGDSSQARVVSGGSINQAFKVPGDPRPLFVKINRAAALPDFEAESEGLESLSAAGGVAVPEVITSGCVGDAAYLALEWVEPGSRTAAAQQRLGAGLASQHRTTNERFGWHRHNTIGATPQRNTPSEDWLEFFRRQRLEFQLELAQRNGLPEQQLSQGRKLCERLESFFSGYRPKPSILHGDLWSGNWGADEAGTPYLFDPAVYYGDRETDLAMTRLFGGFGAAFYAAYDDRWPLAPGWERRVGLYNLYHLLNHFNLFGAGYLGQVATVLNRLLDSR